MAAGSPEMRNKDSTQILVEDDCEAGQSSMGYRSRATVMDDGEGRRT